MTETERSEILKTMEAPNVSPGQAQYILTRAMQDGKIRKSDIAAYSASLQEEINTLEGRLNFLKNAMKPAVLGAVAATAAGKIVRAVRNRKGTGGNGAEAPVRQKTRVTAATRASRKTQGRFLALIRQIPASKRAHFKKVVKERGREAAIKEMQSVLGQ